jgi:triphosphoribosyl-dephospho-CoA synthase
MKTLLTMGSAGTRCGVLPDKSAGAHRLARLACRALIAEAELTPKPGLVDRRGSGSHTDISLPAMRRSAFAIEPYFREMAQISTGATPCLGLRESLGAIGRKAERAMYAATGGGNSHRGAIWSLGLLVSAASTQGETRASLVARKASVIARCEDRHAPVENSHGRLVAAKHGATGARGEAASGFPHVIGVGLPMLRTKRLVGASETFARLDALLGIMSKLGDTCVLYRGGQAALHSVQRGATSVIEAGGCETSDGWRNFQNIDLQLRALGISPGGAADLLAATLFLDAVERRESTVHTDPYKPETHYGND